jgi:succinoglycan biosynthesis protein ExoW
MTENIAVVIPFYQKKTGILSKAIGSALRQVGNFNLIIIVVDDASPVAARIELAELMRNHPGRIMIVEQPNGGPASARNNGLNHVPSGTEYLAFLDSDDEWIAEHIANAMVAMRAGFDFYFSDHYQLNQTVSAFNRAGRIQIAHHPKIGGAEPVHAYQGDMFDRILSGNIIGTSTVLYSFAKYPTLRFREEFVYAGEDYLFWLELSKLTSKIAFSSLCECTYGEGVNIFSGSGWGTEKSLDRLHHEIKYKKALPRLFALTERQLIANRQSIKALRKSFVADLVHRLRHGLPIRRTLLANQFSVDPQTFVQFIPLTIAIAAKR